LPNSSYACGSLPSTKSKLKDYILAIVSIIHFFKKIYKNSAENQRSFYK
jgi:hypothetical protein